MTGGGPRRTTHVFDRSPALGPLLVRGLLPGRDRPRDRAQTSVPAVEYLVHGHRTDAATLADYQRVCGFTVSSAVPATFVHVQAFGLTTALMTRRDFPLPVLGLVHVANRITQHREIDVDEPLDLRVWAADLRDHPAGRQVDLHADARTDGAVVYSSVSTYLHRHRPNTPRAPRPDPGPPPTPRAVWRLPADLGRRYATVSGDRNPIHLSALSARAFGFPRAIAHGMWLNAHVLAVLAPRLPPGFTVAVAFKTPALLPSLVAFDSARSETGDWTAGVRAAKSGKPHLSAIISACSPR